MTPAARVLMLSGYDRPSHHRKVELLADAPDFEILQILHPGNGKATGDHPSANGQRRYHVRTLPVRALGARGDPHRTIHWPPRFDLRAFRPDLIYCEHEQESLMSLEVALARRLAASGAPLVLYSWQNLLRRRAWAVRMVSALTLRAAAHIVCASCHAVEVLTAQGYQRGASVMPLFGVDRREFSPQPRPPDGRFVAGYVGRLVPEKGIETLLRAAAARPRPDLDLLIVGSGPEEARLRLLARELGLECARFTGEVGNRVPEYMNRLDVLVLPSRSTPQWKEQFGRVLVEAMACRVPVVGSDSGAIPEVVGDAGMIFPEGDVAGLAQCLAALSADAALRADLAARGYRRVLENYTVERLADRVLALWRELVRS